MEGQGFRDRAPEFRAADAVVVGASYDSPEDNRGFAEKYDFGFRLLSDEDRAVGPLYGAARPAGDQYADMPLRVTTLIAPDGTVAKTYTVSDVHAHPDEVLADIAERSG